MRVLAVPQSGVIGSWHVLQSTFHDVFNWYVLSCHHVSVSYVSCIIIYCIVMHFRFVPDLICATSSPCARITEALPATSKYLVKPMSGEPSYQHLWTCKKAKQQTCLNAAGRHDCLPQAATLSICNDFFTRGIIYLRQSGWGDLFNCLFMVFARVEKGTSFRMIELHSSPRLQIRRQPSRTLYLVSKSLKFAMRIEHEQQEFPSKQ